MIKALRNILLIALFLYLSALPAFAAEALFEIHSANFNTPIWGYDSATRVKAIAERYVPTTNQTICSVGHVMNTAREPIDSVILRIWKTTGIIKPETGFVVASSSVSASNISISGYTNFIFEPCVNLEANSTYFFVWTRSQLPPFEVISGGGYQSNYRNGDEYPNSSYWQYEGFAAVGGAGWKHYPNREWSFRLDGPQGKEPVLIIPGILGSELYNDSDLIWPDLSEMFFDVGDQFLADNLELDDVGNPINSISVGEVIKSIDLASLNIFNNLIEDLESLDYIFSESYFLSPFDWRLDLSESIDELNQKIEDIKSQTGFPKVNIIAHSMGGLLIKNYINTFGSNSINKLVFIGTPHIGAPKSAKVLLEGDRFSIPWLNPDRMKELSRNSPSSHELLPNETYFSEVGGYLKPYSSTTPELLPTYDGTKGFLLSMGLNPNMFEKAENFFTKDLEGMDFSDIDVYNIAGCKQSTQAGYQFNRDNEISRVGYLSGDETVPLISADYIDIPTDKKFYVKNGEHAELPSVGGVRELILQILEGASANPASNISNSSDFCGFTGTELRWRSPVEVHIYDSNGNHTGPVENSAIEYNIPGVSYDVLGHKKFMFIPTDTGETYQIVAKGLEVGTFDLLISENTNGAPGDTTVFNDVPITDSSVVEFNVAADNPNGTIEIDENGDGSFNTLTADATITGEAGDDSTSPVTEALITGTRGKNSWYVSDVSLELVATDDFSGVMETRYSMDDGATFNAYTSPLMLQSEGVETVLYYSVDRAGNNESIQSLDIKIDKQTPEMFIQFNLEINDFIFGATDNIDPAPEVNCSEIDCLASDEAGNFTLLEFEGKDRKKKHSIELDSITYNGDLSLEFQKNNFHVLFVEKNKSLKDFNQVIKIKAQERAKVNYVGKKDESVVIFKEEGEEKSREVFPGIKFLRLETRQGMLNLAVN